MANPFRSFSKQDFMDIGRAYGSASVARESSEAAGRWKRDVVPLTAYGHGNKPLEVFMALVEQHLATIQSQPGSVATKRNVVLSKNDDFRAAQMWLDKTTCLLKPIAQSNQAFAVRLQAAVPEELSQLPARVGSLKALLVEAKASAPEDAEIDARIADADAIAKKLHEAPGTVSTAKAAKVADTAELDYLDGQLVVAIRNLNEAGTKAIRNGDLEAQYSEYQMKYLRHRKRSAQQADAPEPAPEEPVS